VKFKAGRNLLWRLAREARKRSYGLGMLIWASRKIHLPARKATAHVAAASKVRPINYQLIIGAARLGTA